MANRYSKRNIITLTCIFMLIGLTITQNTQQTLNSKPLQQSTSQEQNQSAQTQSQQLKYTQDIQQFKSKKYNQRLQIVVGCWLLSKEYLQVYKSNYLFFKDLKLKETVTLKLVKECMKKVSRKDAILKITELVGRNIQPPKKYEQIVAKNTIDHIFTQVSKLTIANYHQYQPINQDFLNVESQMRAKQLEQALQNQTQRESSQASSVQPTQIQQPSQVQQTTANESTPPQSQSTFNTLSEFDIFLIDLIKKYNDQFNKLNTGKQGLKGKVQEQLKKKQKYYFGFIPASKFSHSVFLVTIALAMVFCCSCYKYAKMRSSQRAQLKAKCADQSCQDHKHQHSRGKEIKKVAKMTQMTMKKKTR